MTERLRIVIAEDEPELLADLEETLADFGHEVVAAAKPAGNWSSGAETSPDLVITDIKMPDLDGLEAAERIRGNKPVPIVIVSAFHDPAFVERALQEHVLAFLAKPIDNASLKTSITLAMRRFQNSRRWKSRRMTCVRRWKIAKW